MAFVFVKLRGAEHQIEYTRREDGDSPWYEWEFAEPTKFDPKLTAAEEDAIIDAVLDAANQPN